MNAKWADLLTPTGIIALWGALLGTITLIWNIRRDRLQKAETRRTAEQTARQERVRARPRLVPEGGSSSTDHHKFSFRNAGAPIGKLRLVGVEPPAHVNPPHHIGPDDKGYIFFGSKPTLPLVVRVEYEDGLGYKDAMGIELRDGHTFEVLGYDSDKRRSQ